MVIFSRAPDWLARTGIISGLWSVSVYKRAHLCRHHHHQQQQHTTITVDMQECGRLVKLVAGLQATAVVGEFCIASI